MKKKYLMSLTLSWVKAPDDVSEQAVLEYRVVSSSANNIDTVERAETNGNVVVDWTADIDKADIGGLTGSTLYYFNVIVRDENNNRSVYIIQDAATKAMPALPS